MRVPGERVSAKEHNPSPGDLAGASRGSQLQLALAIPCTSPLSPALPPPPCHPILPSGHPGAVLLPPIRCSLHGCDRAK